MLFRTILFNFIVFIDCGLQIPGNLSKRLFSAYHLYQHDCKNKQKNVVSAKKLYLYLYTILMPKILEIVFKSFQISHFSRPRSSFLESPETFRARKAIRKITTCLFCKADLFTCCKGNKNKNNGKVSCLETPSF